MAKNKKRKPETIIKSSEMDHNYLEETIKRKPEAIVKAFEMDPDRCAIYVEGHDDRLFFEHLFENQVRNDTIFFEIATVDIPEVKENGNRERLLNFASSIENHEIRIKCFVDADFTRILGEAMPPNVIFTDFRDLEAYLYERNYLNKFIKLGLKTNKITPESILNELSNAKEIAILRLCSKENEFKLPFQETNENFSRYYVYGKGVNIAKYKNALFQNCETRPKIADFNEALIESKKKCVSLADKDFIHGKDALNIIKEIAKALGYKKDNVELIFWMSFDRADINKYPALKEVENFIK